MAQPKKYQRTKDFAVNTGSATDHPAINGEFDALALTTDQIRANLAKIQADDGGLKPTLFGGSMKQFQDLGGPGGADLVGFSGGSVGAELRRALYAEHKGAIGNGAFDSTVAVLNAIAELRANPVQILNDIGGVEITAYSSGTLNFGPGVFVISADALNLTQDLGLTLRGRGSKRTNNAVKAPTTLLISGTSAGFGIAVSGNGARGLTIEDMDVCYADAGFTGHLLDILNCPGVTLNRAFLGTYGLSAGTRLQTAASLIRPTYDEFLHLNDCVLNGAVDGIWFDDVRGANPFGGSMTKLDNVVFYDFTGDMIRHEGNRTRHSLQLNNCTFNPITVDCQRSIDLNNVEGLTINGGAHSPSVANKAVVEWMRLANCTGHVHGMCFDDLSKAGTIDGMLDISSNRVYCTDGFTLKGGVITGKANEFSKAAAGWKLEPTYQLVTDLGPDYAKAGVTYLFDVPADSVSLSGAYRYSRESDNSVSKFRNASSRVSIANVDGKPFGVPDAAANLSILDTGRTIQATGAVAQTFTLPTPVPGTKLSITKLSAQTLTINCAGATVFYTGAGPVKASVSAAAADVGGSLVLEAHATIGWIVKSQVGTWAFA